jgi:hypothetical protein
VTPQQAIDALDRQLASHGEQVILRRRIAATNTFVEVAVRARLASYRAERAEQLVGSVKQIDFGFIISPTEILAASATWPGAAGGGIHPKIGDFIQSAGWPDRRIESSRPVIIGGGIVRYEGRILG